MHTKSILILGLAGAVLNFGTAFLRLGAFFPTPRLVDFGAFYVSAWALRLGLSPYDLPQHVVADLVARTEIPLMPPPIYNPLSWPILLYPFTFLNYPLAATAWLLLNLALLAATTLMLAEIAGLKDWKAKTLLYLIVVTFGPVFLDMSIGQNGVVLLTLATFTGWTLRSNRKQGEWLGATAVALAASAKLFPLFWAGAFFLLRRWRMLSLTLLITVALIGVGHLLFPAASRMYFEVHLVQRLTSSVTEVSINDQTLTAWLMRMFRPQEFSVQGLSTFDRTVASWQPWLELKEQAVNLVGYGLLLLIGGATTVTIWRYGRPHSEAAFFLWVLLGLLAFPHMERYNHTLLLPAMAWLWHRNRMGATAAAAAYFLAGMARLTHFWATALPATLGALFSGFGVAAVLLLMFVIILQLRQAAAGSEAPG